MKNQSKLKNIYSFLHNRYLFLPILLISLWIPTLAVESYASNPKRLQEGIAEEIIRFHVIANSNSDEDQNLKYKVKDSLVHALSPYLKDAKDINEARAIIEDKMPFIQSVARKAIKNNGYTYKVSSTLLTCYFPIKVYGDYTFPPGPYEALQVKIGDAQGKNWWCVMFPPLCFVDETYSIVEKDCDEKLEYLLTDEELEAIKEKKVPIKIKLKLLESIKKLFA